MRCYLLSMNFVLLALPAIKSSFRGGYATPRSHCLFRCIALDDSVHFMEFGCWLSMNFLLLTFPSIAAHHVRSAVPASFSAHTVFASVRSACVHSTSLDLILLTFLSLSFRSRRHVQHVFVRLHSAFPDDLRWMLLAHARQIR